MQILLSLAFGTAQYLDILANGSGINWPSKTDVEQWSGAHAWAVVAGMIDEDPVHVVSVDVEVPDLLLAGLAHIQGGKRVQLLGRFIQGLVFGVAIHIPAHRLCSNCVQGLVCGVAVRIPAHRLCSTRLQGLIWGCHSYTYTQALLKQCALIQSQAYAMHRGSCCCNPSAQAVTLTLRYAPLSAQQLQECILAFLETVKHIKNEGLRLGTLAKVHLVLILISSLNSTERIYDNRCFTLAQ